MISGTALALALGLRLTRELGDQLREASVARASQRPGHVGAVGERGDPHLAGSLGARLAREGERHHAMLQIRQADAAFQLLQTLEGRVSRRRAASAQRSASKSSSS